MESGISSQCSGKNYIVTGASSGIGREVSIKLAQNCANVVLIGKNIERLEKTLSMMQKGNHTILQFDVSKIDKIYSTINILLEKYRIFDGLVYCAGVGGRTKLRDTTYESIHAIMMVNFYGFIEFVRSLSRTKKKTYPMHIVGMSSLASSTHEKYYLGYASSKSAMEAAVRTLASELLLRNTTICTIRAGFVDTPMLYDFQEYSGGVDEFLRKSGYQPMGLIPPAYIAELILYLLGDSARYITGTSIVVNAGAAE